MAARARAGQWEFGSGNLSATFVVQSYRAGNRGGLMPDSPVLAQDTGHARRMAARLAATKAMVIAFVREGDSSTGEYEEARLIAVFGPPHGELPDEVREMRRDHALGPDPEPVFGKM